MGGLARVASVISGMKRAGAPVLFLDLGDSALPLDSSLGATDLAIGRGKAEVVYEALAAMGAVGQVPGELDLALDPEFLRRVARAAGVPLLAANLRGSDGAPLFEERVIVELAGLRTLVIGVYDPALLPASLAATGVTATDPAAAAARVIDEAGPVELVIVGGHLEEGLEAQLLAAVPRIDLLVAAHGAAPMPGGRPGGNGVVARAAGKGRFLGRVDLLLPPTWQPGQRLQNGGERKEAGAKWAEARGELDRMIAELGGKTPLEAFADDPARRFRFAELASRASSAEETLARFAGQSLFATALTPLDNDVGEDAAINARIAAWKRGEISRFRAAALAAPAVPASSSSYGGRGACVGCHPVEVSAWQLSAHARAYRTLVEKESEFNPSCVGCHTTGFRLPGGFADPGQVGLHADVQCEQCHGPATAHAAGDGPSPPKTSGEALCVACHTPANDDHWNHAVRLEAIRHWGAGFPPVR